MKLHSYFTSIPTAGAIGAAVMAYNSSINVAKHLRSVDNKSDGFGTSALSFMGAQDVFIAGALFIGFAALARGTYQASQGSNRSGSKWFKLAGSMLLAAGLYALTAGFFNGGLEGSKIGGFDNKGEAAGFGVVYSVLALIGAALVGTGYQMSTKKVFRNSDVPEGHDRDGNINNHPPGIDL